MAKKNIDYDFILKNDSRYFTCTFCEYFQLYDGGNYYCWTCEDGNIPLPIPEWRTKERIDWKSSDWVEEIKDSFNKHKDEKIITN